MIPYTVIFEAVGSAVGHQNGGIDLVSFVPRPAVIEKVPVGDPVSDSGRFFVRASHTPDRWNGVCET